MKFLRRINFVNVLNTALIFILLFLNIYLLNNNLNIKKQIHEKKFYPVFERMLELQLEEGKILDKNIQFIDTNRLNVYLKDVLTNEPKMILFYNDKTCSPCVATTVKTLESMIDSFKFIENNLVIISDDYNSLSTHNLKTRFNNYKMTSGKLGFKNDDINEPILFLLDTNYVTKMLIIPYYYDNNSLNKYLKLIEEYFFKKV